MAERARAVLLRLGGSLIPLVQQIPPLGAYTGLMTLPFAAYLVALFSNFPYGIVEAFEGFFLWSFSSLQGLVSMLASMLGLLIAMCSAFYLRLHKKDGLVTTGPYRYVRHPQYTGLLVWTIGLTCWSYWVLTHTFGVGWLTPQGTIGLWYLEMCAYLLLAFVEELYLSKRFGKEYANYINSVPFLIPLVRARRYDIPITVFALSIVLFAVVHLE
jgi:protein-S-isoprenylcysteine O-methyltransferase Ste14